MARKRKIGITDRQRNNLGNWTSTGRNRLKDSPRKNVKYDIKEVIEKELEDLLWFFTEVGGLRACPFELVLPQSRNRYASKYGDLGALLDAIKQIEEWQAALDKIKKAMEGKP